MSMASLNSLEDTEGLQEEFEFLQVKEPRGHKVSAVEKAPVLLGERIDVTSGQATIEREDRQEKRRKREEKRRRLAFELRDTERSYLAVLEEVDTVRPSRS